MDSDGRTVVPLVAVFGTVVSRLPAVRLPTVCRLSLLLLLCCLS